mmetsp:Transcript_62013/g.134474  ORF Transcript_62013/g.134474 Transcript_62013/m.134474 type:complete len:234 (+) Transcript_62013:170-871(+)
MKHEPLLGILGGRPEKAEAVAEVLGRRLEGPVRLRVGAALTHADHGAGLGAELGKCSLDIGRGSLCISWLQPILDPALYLCSGTGAVIVDRVPTHEPLQGGVARDVEDSGQALLDCAVNRCEGRSALEARSAELVLGHEFLAMRAPRRIELHHDVSVPCHIVAETLHCQGRDQAGGMRHRAHVLLLLLLLFLLKGCSVVLKGREPVCLRRKAPLQDLPPLLLATGSGCPVEDR